ncbi:MAG TPA: carboxymuconolactone decarboxylase family protein [Actinocrinis sp.]|uniref:carboxymuconolactone decarboxylase family protein n=1 Tax=Actinocrinis sp. TaxID=1920516 RepID=UPI002DDDB116|nr:carboxymuconolactone decarboxylase family protein [Actinocrinis sp.]HEV2347857.1 carboxymuconolactone decarboxylase family protein [Actinocrinis sp.]
MSRIPARTLDDAPEAVRDTLEKFARRNNGRPRNIYAGMAHAPIVLAAYDAMSSAIAQHSTFDTRTREAIALAVGAQDGCQYCQSAHTPAAVAAGFTADETLAIRRGEVEFDPKLSALLALAREIAANVGDVSDVAWKQALAAGWGDEELAELFAHVAANLFTNYFNHYAETELDVTPAPEL